MADELEPADMMEATLSLAEASSRTWDAIVVGAGPAGALAARELARLGCSTLLVDRAAFPRGKVCGCCINARAQASLASVGLSELTSRAGAVPLQFLRLGSGKSAAILSLEGGSALSRGAFDTALARSAIECGASFLPSTMASLARDEPNSQVSFRVVQLRQRIRERDIEVEVAARVVLAADGLGSMLLSKGGIAEAPAQLGSRMGAGVIIDSEDAFYAPGAVYMACGPDGYVGLVCLEDNRLDIASAMDTTAVRSARGPGGLARRMLESAGWPVPVDLENLPWRGTAPLTRQARRVAGLRLFALGDAAGYVEPFTGEGIALALASAIAVAPLALQGAKDWSPRLAQSWTECHKQIVRRRQRAIRVLAGVLRSPWMTTALVWSLARCPWLAAPVMRYLDKPDRLHAR